MDINQFKKNEITPNLLNSMDLMVNQMPQELLEIMKIC